MYKPLTGHKTCVVHIFEEEGQDTEVVDPPRRCFMPYKKVFWAECIAVPSFLTREEDAMHRDPFLVAG